MDKKKKVVISFVFLVILVTILYSFSGWISNTTGYAAGIDEKVELAKCLEDKNAILYGERYCSQCEAQKDIFGLAIGFVEYRDCGLIECEFETLPVWEIQEQRHEGFLSFEELKRVSEC